MHKLLNALPVVLIICMLLTNIFAADIDIIDDILNTDGEASVNEIDDAAMNIWATIVPIVQILSVAAVVFAGLRYMFASADQKADIKKSMGILVIGAILVFCSTTILKFIATAANDALTS